MGAEVRYVDPIPVIGVEHVGPYPEIGRAFEAVFSKATSQGWPIQGCLGIYFSDPRVTPEAELVSKACVIVPTGFEADGEETFSVGGCTYAVYRHVGPYSGLPAAWTALYSEELPRLGMTDTGPPFEHYVSDMAVTPPEELITDLYVPVD